MAKKQENQEQTLGHAPTTTSKVVRNSESIRDTRTLAGHYLTQRPDSAKRN